MKETIGIQDVDETVRGVKVLQEIALTRGYTVAVTTGTRAGMRENVMRENPELLRFIRMPAVLLHKMVIIILNHDPKFSSVFREPAETCKRRGEITDRRDRKGDAHGT